MRTFITITNYGTGYLVKVVSDGEITMSALYSYKKAATQCAKDWAASLKIKTIYDNAG